MKKENILRLAIVTILLISLVIIVLLIVNKKEENSLSEDANSNEQTSNESEKLNSDEELIYNNYLITYLIEGDVIIGESYILKNAEIYYILDDGLLQNIKSISDINNLMENNLTDAGYSRANYILNMPDTNNYVENNGYLYVKKSDSHCEKLKFVTDKKDIKVTKDGKVKHIDWLPFGITLNGTDEKMPSLIFSCRSEATEADIFDE